MYFTLITAILKLRHCKYFSQKTLVIFFFPGKHGDSTMSVNGASLGHSSVVSATTGTGVHISCLQ